MSHHTIEFTLPDDAYEMNCAIHQVYRSTLQRIAEELHRRVKYRDEGDDDLEDFQRWLHEELKDVGIDVAGEADFCVPRAFNVRPLFALLLGVAIGAMVLTVMP